MPVVDKIVTGPFFQQKEAGALVVNPTGRALNAGFLLRDILAGASPGAVPAVGIVATPSGVQATALLMSTGINSVDTVATAADAVKLPPAVAGLSIFVVNTTATSMQVFGSGTDTINGVATATGVAQAGGKSAMYVCTVGGTAGKWFRLLSA